jgi:2-polyprenyl-3-methyl-5-hydroxy-6-metoxy-1,4-benzoquinol methylase
VDIGSGPGNRLAKYFQDFSPNVKGFDVASAIKVGRKINPGINFSECDLSRSVIPSNHEWDLVISADVIEHLDEPNNLLESAKNLLSKNGLFVLSTPDRGILYENQMLKPGNIQHVREWNIDELCQYLKASGFSVERAFHEEAYGPALDKTFASMKLRLGSKTRHCIVVLCRYAG